MNGSHGWYQDSGRYLRWRTAFSRPVWTLDRHFYEMVGRLYLYEPRRVTVLVRDGVFVGQPKDSSDGD